MFRFEARHCGQQSLRRQKRAPLTVDNRMRNDHLDRLTSPANARVVERNVNIISDNRRKAEAQRTLQQRIADWVTAFAGSMVFVHLHIVWFAAWILINKLIVTFDPAFTTLTMIVSLEAIFLSAFILVSQNRRAALADQHDELDLQINLLDEYETTRILELVTALAEKAGIKCDDPERAELEADVEPDQLLDRLADNHDVGASNGKKQEH
jgi:uncharacterized membrane protein